MKNNDQQSSTLRLYLCGIFIFLRLLITLDDVRRKCDCQWKRQTMMIFDLLLFILVNASLLRDSNARFLRIGQKLSLGLIVFQLKNLLGTEAFWATLNDCNGTRQGQPNSNTPLQRGNLNMTKMLLTILDFRWISSFLIISFYGIVTFHSIMIDENGSLFSISHIVASLNTHKSHAAICMVVIRLIYQDTWKSRKTLNQSGVSCFCIGFDLNTKPETGLPRNAKPQPTPNTQQNPSQNAYVSAHQFPSKLLSPRSDDQTVDTKPVSLKIGQGTIQIEKGDITKQTIDVIIGSSSSQFLRESLLNAAGDESQMAYTRECEANPKSLVISIPPGKLQCKRIFFPKWQPNKDDKILRQSIVDLISNVVQNVCLHDYASIAFPAIGCGAHACSVGIVVKTMVKQVQQEIHRRNLPWTVKFVIRPAQENVYDEFCKQLLSSDPRSSIDEMPFIWQPSEDGQIRFVVPKSTPEYHSIIDKFVNAMKEKNTNIIKLERIQNERWYMQYMAHWKDFKKRLNTDTEKHLYHGCPDSSADSIIQDCFNRSFAGVNGVVYGFGVYFSSDPTYAHDYAKRNVKGERCMFVARVLVGKSTPGNAKMKTRPLGFDSTTGGNHITVTYHDAQAYAEYLITYQ